MGDATWIIPTSARLIYWSPFAGVKRFFPRPIRLPEGSLRLLSHTMRAFPCGSPAEMAPVGARREPSSHGVWRRAQPAPLAGGEKVLFDEGGELPIEHGVDIAHFHIGAMILDQAVGMQDVRADLMAPGDVFLGLRILLEFLRPFLLLQLIEARA